MVLEGTINARDIGGIMTEEGYRVKEGLFLRTDSLHALSDQAVEMLRDRYNVSKIIDMRTGEERAEKPDREINGADNYHIPVFTEAEAGITRENGHLVFDDTILDMARTYEFMISSGSCTEKLSEILRQIIHNDKGASLYHCTAGKDRTGIVSMLILGLLGVSEDNIMKDYLETNVTGKAVAEEAAKMALKVTGRADLAEKVLAAYSADESYLRAALDYIYNNYGTIENYCRDKLGIPQEDIDLLRTKALDRS